MSYNLPRKPVKRAAYSYASVGEESEPSEQIASPHSQHELAESSPYRFLKSPVVGTTNEDESEEKLITSTSQWNVDWQTTATLIGLYAAALAAAIGHLIFFLKLNNVRTSEYYIPQGYVTTISNLIATAWGVCLSVCLSVVFTQSLWNVLRSRFTSVADIEKLYGLVGNVFLARPRLMVSMPILYLIAALSWSVSVVKTLPPGALTVETRPFFNTTDIKIPVYNSSFVGNGSIMDFTGYVAGGSSIIYPPRGIRVTVSGATIQDNLKKAFTYYFATGALQTYPSPCGVNCSFVLEFEGPYLDCNTTTHNTTIKALNTLVSGQNNQLMYPLYTANYTSTVLNIQKFRPINVPLVKTSNSSTPRFDQTLVEVNNVTCQYATALYTVNTTYTSGAWNISYANKPLGVVDYPSNCQDHYQETIGRNSTFTISGTSCGNLGSATGSDGNLVLSDLGRSAFKMLKNLALTKYLLVILAGNIQQTCSLSDQVTDGESALSCSLGSIDTDSAPVYGTFIYNTTTTDYLRISNIGGPLSAPIPNIRTSADELNAALFNLTMVYTYSGYNYLDTNITATQNWQLLTYVFSRPLNLILPYFIPLGLAAFAVAYALVLLYHKHHVAAMGDSFIQILMTTTGAETIRKVAASGCLGGTNNIPKELEDLKVKYGDVTEPTTDEADAATAVRRAGFGVEGEVRALRRRAVYGSSSPTE